MRKHNAADYVQQSGGRPASKPRMTAETDAAEQYFSTIAAALSGSRSSCATTARRSIGTASSPRSWRAISRGWKNPSRAGATGWASRDLQDFARRERLSDLPERARAGERQAPGQPAAGVDPRGQRDPQRDGRLHPAPQGIPGGAAAADGRAALSRGRQGRHVFSPFMLAETAKVSVNPKMFRPYYLVHWASFDGSANLPLIYMATIEDSSEAMVAPAGRPGRQAQRQGRHPAAGRGPAQSRSSPTASTISPRRTPPIRCRRRRSRSISTRISSRCTPSSCAASCWGPSIRRASPRTIRR